MDAEQLWQRLAREGIGTATLAAMARVPRDQFVPVDLRGAAWEDRPLPLGRGQTISQPLVVGMMTDAAAVGPGDVALDVGTGSGYQAAVLATCGARVHGIERIAELADSARSRLARLGFAVTVVHGDGTAGLPEAGPFDAIVVGAAAATVPDALLAQLRKPGPDRPGGRLVIPVTESGGRAAQRLVCVQRTAAGYQRRELSLVRFVPLLPGTAGAGGPS